MSVRPSTVDVPYGYEDDVSPYAWDCLNPDCRKSLEKTTNYEASKTSYDKGEVVVCPACKVQHLIVKEPQTYTVTRMVIKAIKEM